MIAAFTNQVSGEPGAAHWQPTLHLPASSDGAKPTSYNA